MTEGMLDALREFKRTHGKRWKSSLRALWLEGRDEGALRRVRNVVGAGGKRLEKIERTLHL